MVMNLRYEDFMQTVPVETQHFMRDYLKLLRYYVMPSRLLELKGDRGDIRGEEVKTMLALLALSMTTKSHDIKQLLDQHKFDPSVIKLKQALDEEVANATASAEVAYNKFSQFFNIANTRTDYSMLLPTDIIEAVAKGTDNITYSDSRQLFDNNYSNYANLKSAISQYNRVMKDKNLKNLKLTFFEDMDDMSVINFLERVSVMYTFLSEKISKGEYDKTLTLSEDDAASLALFFTTLYDTNIASELFKKEGVTLEKSLKYLGIRIPDNVFATSKPNISIVKDIFTKFVFEGSNTGIARGDISIESVVKNIFDRKMSKGLVIERLIDHCGSSIERFKDFDSLVANIRDEFEITESERKKTEFYANLDSRTIDFIEFMGKTYTLIISQMKKGEYNKAVLNSEEAADTLALLISSYFFDNDVVQFFKGHSITLDGLLKYVGVSFTAEDVSNMVCSVDTLTEKYKRYVFDGVNKNKNPKDISVDSIIRNLCNTTFNKSQIINKLFKEFSSGTNLPDNFLDTVEKYIVEKEKERIARLEDTIFRNCDYSAIALLENASIMFQYIKRKYPGLDNSVAESAALFMGLYFVDSKNETRNDLLEFFAHNNVTSSKVFSLTNESGARSFIGSNKCDMDVVADRFTKYMPGEVLEDRQIGIYDIARNLFNDDVHYSFKLKEALGKFDSAFEYFDDFDTRFNNFQEQKVEEERRRQKDELYGGMAPREMAFMQHIDDVHKTLIANLRNGGTGYSEADIPYLSTFISLFLSPNKVTEYIEHHGMDLNVILNSLGVDKITEDMDVDIPMLLEQYKGILRNYGRVLTSVDDIARNLFNSMPDNNAVAKLLSANGHDYSILKKEVIDGEIYVAPLTDEERMVLLVNTPVPVLDAETSPIGSGFGRVIEEHELAVAAMVDGLPVDVSITNTAQHLKESIGGIIIQPEEPQRRGLFSKKNAESVETIVKIDREALAQYYSELSAQVAALEDRQGKYELIQEYLGIVMDKMSDYAVSLNDELTELKGQVKPAVDGASFRTLIDNLNLNNRISKIKSEIKATVDSLNLKYALVLQMANITMNDSAIIGSLKQQKADLYPHAIISSAISKGIQNQRKTIEIVQAGSALFDRIISTHTLAIGENNVATTTAMVTNLEANPITLEAILADKPTLVKGRIPVLPAADKGQGALRKDPTN